jgi:uncharacterized membrane protein
MKEQLEKFFSEEEKKNISTAISKAEARTDAEIRIHLEISCKKDPLKRAKEVFAKLKMHKTKQRNGILFYIAVEDKKFAVFGDKGIAEKVPEDFWQEEKNLVIENFKNSNYEKGLIQAIEIMGEKLAELFPFSGYKNELSNEISFSEPS